MREKIGKALKARSEAIQTALREYNAAATQLGRPEMTWATVLKAVTLADFDLLRDTRSDIRSLPWTEPSRREACTLYFGIRRAEEEILRLDVEIVRLLTYMLDVHADYQIAISVSKETNPALAFELTREWEHLDRVHRSIAHRLADTSRLKGFTGSLQAGIHVGRESTDLISLPQWAEEIGCFRGATTSQKTHSRGTQMLDNSRNIYQSPGIADGEGGANAYDVPQELEDINANLLVQLVERISCS